MTPTTPLLYSIMAVAMLSNVATKPTQAQIQGHPKPNIIFILADDMGFGDFGVFFQNARRRANNRSQAWHMTPQLDAMAAQGLQLPQHYCGAPVCAPSRASFLTGLHQGHATVRDNQFDKALEDNYTVPAVLRQAEYSTACIGKWGLQGEESATVPNGWVAHPQNRGFDSFFGYIPHVAGHAHYPKEDGKRLFDGDKNVVADYDGCYTTDLFTARAKKWIIEKQSVQNKQPFFLYLALDTPHAKLQYPPGPFPAGGGLKGGVQWLGQPGQMINTAKGRPDSYCYPDYANATWDDDKNPVTAEKQWPDVYKRYATDVRRIDDCVGDLLQLLKDLKIDDNTLVIFTSDNGPSDESYLTQSNNPNFFASFGPFDGIKRDVWEGGIRVGAIARWPSQIAAGRISQHSSGFWDWLPTFASAANLPLPERCDGVSLLPTLQGKGTQQPSRLYFEYAFDGQTPSYPEFAPSHRGRQRRQMQALRIGDYMGVRYNVTNHSAPFEIFDIVNDPQETNNLASEPAFQSLQQQLHDTVLQVRRPNASAPRPYDDELVPAVKLTRTNSGLIWKAMANSAPWIAQLDGVSASSQGVASRPVWPTKLSSKLNQISFKGFLEVPEDGEYTFSIQTDSEVLLRLHEGTIIDAELGPQPGSPLRGVIKLKAGKHPFSLSLLQVGTGVPSLQLRWSSPVLAEQEIPATAFGH